MRDPAAQRRHTLRAHLRETMRLAVPVMLARLGVLTIITMDTAMSGHASGEDLAWYGVAIAPQIPLLLVGIGLLMGTIVMVAQAVGAGHPEQCGAIWRTSLGARGARRCGDGDRMRVRRMVPPCDGTARGHRGPEADGCWRHSATECPGCCCTWRRASSSKHRPSGPGDGDHHRGEHRERGLELAADLRPRGISGPGCEGAAIASSIVRWCMFAAAALYVLRFVNRRRFGITAAADPAERFGLRMRRIGLPRGSRTGWKQARSR